MHDAVAIHTHAHSNPPPPVPPNVHNQESLHARRTPRQAARLVFGPSRQQPAAAALLTTTTCSVVDSEQQAHGAQPTLLVGLKRPSTLSTVHEMRYVGVGSRDTAPKCGCCRSLSHLVMSMRGSMEYKNWRLVSRFVFSITRASRHAASET